MDKKTPPEELVLAAEEITKQWLTGKHCSVEVYLQGSDFDDEWRFRIVSDIITDKYKRIITEHLTPGKIDGHTCSLFCSTWMNAMSDGIEKGLMRSIKKHMEVLCVEAGVRADKHLAYLNNGAEESALAEQLRQQSRLRNC